MIAEVKERLCLICGKPTKTIINNGSYHRRCVKRSILGGDGPPYDRSWTMIGITGLLKQLVS